MATVIAVETVVEILRLRFESGRTYLSIARSIPTVSEKTIYRICKGLTHSDERSAFLAQLKDRNAA